MFRIISIVILYNPTREMAEKWKKYVCNMIHCFFCFIDNSDNDLVKIEASNACTFSPKQNLGVAAAQNIGIKYALENKFEYILFFDQDSEFDNLYVERMVEEFVRIKKKESKIAIMGPTVINKDSSQEYKNSDDVNNDGYATVSHLISSGEIIDSCSAQNIGMMEERLFIDYVDFEWCWRAYKKGFICVRTHNVFLKHKVGNRTISFWGYPINISAPIRYYYQYRNFLWLLRRDYVPKSWKKRMLVRKIVEMFLLPLKSADRRNVLKNICRGIKAGIFA